VLRGGGHITAAQAKDPDDETMTKINELRVAAVELITGTALIGGMDPSVVRDQQKLPTDSAEATHEIAGWREGRHWWAPLAQRHQSAAFMFAVAVTIGITVVVLVSEHGVPHRIAQFYGELRNGQLRRTVRRGNAPIWIDNWYGHALQEALQLLIDAPGCYSVVRLHSSHFEPWHYLGPSI